MLLFFNINWLDTFRTDYVFVMVTRAVRWIKHAVYLVYCTVCE